MVATRPDENDWSHGDDLARATVHAVADFIDAQSLRLREPAAAQRLATLAAELRAVWDEFCR